MGGVFGERIQHNVRDALGHFVMGDPIAERLLAKTDRLYGDPPEHDPSLGNCWPWLGARNGFGRAVIKIVCTHEPRHRQGHVVSAPRLALEVALGRPLAPDLYCNHHCDNSACVRPRHLYEGTPKRNVLDALERGRHRGFQTGDGTRWQDQQPDVVGEWEPDEASE